MIFHDFGIHIPAIISPMAKNPPLPHPSAPQDLEIPKSFIVWRHYKEEENVFVRDS